MMCFAVEFCLFVARARVAFVIERDVFVCVIAGAPCAIFAYVGVRGVSLIR